MPILLLKRYLWLLLLLSRLKTVVLLNISVEMVMLFQDCKKIQFISFFFFFKTPKNVFTVTSDQFNASLLGKSINLFQKNC